MSTAIIDYGAGNLKSVENALLLLGEKPVITRDPEEMRNADRIILPGVGSFGDAMQRIRQDGLEEVICTLARSGKPFLGICLGLQLLFEESEESPGVKGLGILKGKIRKIPETAEEGQDYPAGESVKVPQIGWNSLSYPNPGRLFQGIPEHSHVYFVHSYYLRAADPSIVTAACSYSVRIDASVESGNLFACQFHPEKSEKTGLHILRNFLSIESIAERQGGLC